MSRLRIILIIVALVAAAVLSIFLRDLVRDYVILPLSLLWWAFLVVYRAIPQVAYWMVLLAVIIFLTIGSFYTSRPEKKKKGENSILDRDSVGRVAYWIDRGRRGIYFKWRIARMLAEIAANILEQRERYSRRRSVLEGQDWHPPKDIQDYLQSALNTTYADYPRASPWLPQPPTPFDRDLNPIVEFLESQMESEDDNTHS